MTDLRAAVEGLPDFTTFGAGIVPGAVGRHAVLALIPKDAVLVTADDIAEAFLDPYWQIAFHRWMTTGWSNTKNAEALPLAEKLVTLLRGD